VRILTSQTTHAAVSTTPQVGIPVLVVEREASLRLEGSAIAMWANAFRALDALGVGDALRCSHPLLERCGTWRPTPMMQLWDPAPVMRLRTMKAAWTAPLGRCSHRMHLGQSTPHTMHLPCTRRTELCSRDGRLLRAFDFNRDCEGGPHEASPQLAGGHCCGSLHARTWLACARM
jgi:hypothetical protein